MVLLLGGFALPLGQVEVLESSPYQRPAQESKKAVVIGANRPGMYFSYHESALLQVLDTHTHRTNGVCKRDLLRVRLHRQRNLAFWHRERRRSAVVLGRRCES